MGRINPIFWPGGWLAEKAYDICTNQEDETSNEAVREDEMKRVEHLIEKGRQQGLSECNIKISHGLSKKLSASGGAPIEGIPMNVAFDVGSDSNGDYVMHIKYLPKTGLEKFEDLKILHDKGILTEQEYSDAKKELLKQL